MQKINRKIEYALIGLKHMGMKRPGELTSVKELNQVYGCPFDLTSRVMQTLVQAEILRSVQGAQGGYQILQDLNRVSFYQLNEILLGPTEIAKCLQGGERSACEIRETCNIVSPMQNLNRKLTEFYRGVMLAELLEMKSPLQPEVQP